MQEIPEASFGRYAIFVAMLFIVAVLLSMVASGALVSEVVEAILKL